MGPVNAAMRLLQAGSEGWHGAATQAGRLAGARIACRREQFAGRAGGMFHDQRLGISSSLHLCLATTNVIESLQSGVRMRTRRVCGWRDAAMVERWAAASFLATERNFRRIMGWKDLWQLEAILGRKRSEDAATMQEVA